MRFSLLAKCGAAAAVAIAATGGLAVAGALPGHFGPLGNSSHHAHSAVTDTTEVDETTTSVDTTLTTTPVDTTPPTVKRDDDQGEDQTGSTGEHEGGDCEESTVPCTTPPTTVDNGGTPPTTVDNGGTPPTTVESHGDDDQGENNDSQGDD